MCAAMLFGSVAMFGGIASAAYEKQGFLTFQIEGDGAVLIKCDESATGEITEMSGTLQLYVTDGCDEQELSVDESIVTAL